MAQEGFKYAKYKLVHFRAVFPFLSLGIFLVTFEFFSPLKVWLVTGTVIIISFFPFNIQSVMSIYLERMLISKATVGQFFRRERPAQSSAMKKANKL